MENRFLVVFCGFFFCHSIMNYLQISGIVGGNFDLGKIDTYIHLREDNGVEPFHQFGLELDVMEVRFDYMSTSVLMGRVSHLLLKVSKYITVTTLDTT